MGVDDHQDVVVVRKRYKKRKPIYKEHLDALCDILDREVSSPTKHFNLKLLFYVLFFTGLRINEALLLSRKQLIDFIHGHSIDVYTPKTDSTRQLINTPAIYNDLQFFRDNEHMIHDNGFVNCNNEKLTDRRAEKYMYPLFTLLEVQVEKKLDDPVKRLYNSHGFRVGYINRLLKHFPVHEVSYAVGHSNVQTTFKYTRSQRDIARYNDYLRDKSF